MKRLVLLTMLILGMGLVSCEKDDEDIKPQGALDVTYSKDGYHFRVSSIDCNCYRIESSQFTTSAAMPIAPNDGTPHCNDYFDYSSCNE